METTRITIAISNTPHATQATMATVRPMFDPDGPVKNRVCKEQLELTKLVVTLPALLSYIL